jgi:valyl-tRNA synthetase
MNIVENAKINIDDDYKTNITEATDKSWLKRLSDAVKGASKSFAQNDYAQALDIIEKAFWDFCNNYLEIVKGRAYNSENKSAVNALMFTLDTFIKLFAPFCPFVTEEIYQACSWTNGKTIHLEPWPNMDEFANIISDDTELYDALSVISSEIRKEKTNANVSLKTPVTNIQIKAPARIIDVIKQGQEDLVNVGNLNTDAASYTVADELSVCDITLGQLESAQ